MRRHDNLICKTKWDAIDDLVAAVRFNPTVEEVPLEEAIGRVAAEDVASLNDAPNKLASRMDGIAVKFAAFEGAGEGGAPDTSGWTEGVDYVFCNTGIGIDGDFDTAIRIEDVEFEDGKLVINQPPKERGQFTVQPGSNMKKGETVVRAHDILSPLLLSQLATGGHDRVKVIRKPVVAFIPTGNELVAPGTPVPPGKNTDSNSIMMRGKIVQWGGEPLMYPIQPDLQDAILATIEDALSRADIVVLNGGSSQGSDDHTEDVLEKVGTVLSNVIYSGPGAHTSCTVTPEGKPIVGIPGPAVGAECTADWFVMPLVDTYFGRRAPLPRVRAKYVGEDSPARDGLFSMIRRAMIERRDDGELVVRPVDFDDKRAMDAANAFIVYVPEGIENGQLIDAELRFPYRVL